MDTWILSENETLCANLHGALVHSGVDCPNERMFDLSSVQRVEDQLVGAKGIVFLAVRQFGNDHCQLVRCLRSILDRDATIAVATSGANDLSVVQAVRAGANDFLTLDSSLPEEVSSLLDRIRESQRLESTEGTVVTVLPCQSHSDASFTALNLSAAFTNMAGSCMVGDLHFSGGDLALLLKLDHRHNVVDLLTQTEAIDEAMLRQVVVHHESGISLLPGPDLLTDRTGMRLPLCRDVIALARTFWPVVVVNTDDMFHAKHSGVLTMSDAVVLAIRLDIASVHRAKQCIALLLDNHVPREMIHVAAIGVGVSGELPARSVKKVLQVDNFYCIPDDQEAALKSTNIGNPLLFEQPNSKPAKALRACAESVLRVEVPSKASTLPWTGFKAASFLALNALTLCR